MARTDTLPHFLTDVADAIREKKGTQATIQASNFDTEIESIPSGGNIGDYFGNLTSDTSNTATLVQKVVKKIPAISVPSSITNLQNCFKGCTGLTSIDFSNWDTSSVTNMRNMFDTCIQLTTLDLSSFDTSNVTRMDYMFSYCTRLLHIDMRSFNFSSVSNSSEMFGSSATGGVPDNCEIIVADNTAKTWITDKFSRLTNVKTVAEYEAE